MSESNIPNYYRILGVAQQASTREIKQAFRQLARQYHPDLNPDDASASTHFRKICEAYDILGDSERRRAYDHRLQSRVQAAGTNATEPLAESGYQAGLTKLAARDYLGAVADFTAAIADQPDHWMAYLRRCEAYEALRQYREMLEDCRLMLEQRPDWAEALHYKGRARYHLGYTQSALDAYTEALRVQTDFAPAYYDRGLAHLDVDDRAAAIADLQRAAEYYGQQQQWTQLDLTQKLLNRLHRRAHSPSRSRQGRGPGWLRWWPWLRRHQSGDRPSWLRTAARLLTNPTGRLAWAYSHLTLAEAQHQGVGLGAIATLGVGIGGYLLLRPVMSLPWWWGFLAGAVGFLVLTGSISLVRLITRCRGDYAADLFIAGASVLPLGCGMLLLPLGTMLAPVVTLGLGLMALGWAMLTLYTGLTQLHTATEGMAAIAAPNLLLVTLWIPYLLIRYGLG